MKMLYKALFILISSLVLLMGNYKNCYTENSSKTRHWNASQLEKINKTNNRFSFAVFGDNRGSTKIFESLIDEINKDNLSFAIDIGDLVNRDTKKDFIFFAAQIKKLNKPFLTAIGNHELIGGRINYYELFGKFFYSFATGNSYFIILDDANGRKFSPQQMDWLKEELNKGQNYKYRFVFMHIPLYDPRKGEYKRGHSLRDLSFAKKLNGIFDKYNITMLFTSHIHGYFRGIWGKTPYIITGGAGAKLYGADPRHFFYHYIKVNVSANGVKYRIVKINSSTPKP